MWLRAKVVIAVDKESCLVWMLATLTHEISTKKNTMTGWRDTQDWINRKKKKLLRQECLIHHSQSASFFI